MKIREARKQDAGQLSEIAVEAVTPYRALDFTAEGWTTFLSSTSPAATEMRLVDTRYCCFCAESRDGIEGFITIKDAEKIEQLFVRPRSQGAGVAKRLWRYASAVLSSERKPRDYWVKSSTVAVPFYRQVGFVECGGPVRNNGITYQLMRIAGETVR